MKNVFAIALLLLCANTAHAQMTTTTAFTTPSSAFAEPIFRVTTPFRVALPAAEEGQSVHDAKTLESARHSLYRMAEAECATLSEIYKADCRLSTLSINTTGPTGATVPGIFVPAASGSSTVAPVATTMNANVVYDLRIKGR